MNTQKIINFFLSLLHLLFRHHTTLQKRERGEAAAAAAAPHSEGKEISQKSDSKRDRFKTRMK
jgi:hypothetical protein